MTGILGSRLVVGLESPDEGRNLADEALDGNFGGENPPDDVGEGAALGVRCHVEQRCQEALRHLAPEVGLFALGASGHPTSIGTSIGTSVGTFIRTLTGISSLALPRGGRGLERSLWASGKGRLEQDGQSTV